jgi:hypothetical protein
MLLFFSFSLLREKNCSHCSHGVVFRGENARAVGKNRLLANARTARRDILRILETEAGRLILGQFGAGGVVHRWSEDPGMGEGRRKHRARGKKAGMGEGRRKHRATGKKAPVDGVLAPVVRRARPIPARTAR